jgi:hypothetical protein
MKVELQKQLYEKYPKIFDGHMYWGIETGDGWYNLIDNLCGDIQKHVDESGCPQAVALQIKEKFGGLRFYISGGDGAIDCLIISAEQLSETTCEECGDPGNLFDDGWLKVRCEKHKNEKN